MPTTSLVLALAGVSPLPQGVAPLTLVFPQAGAGCDVLLQPDVIAPLVTTTGAASWTLDLPLTASLVGAAFRHQMVPIEVDAQGRWVAVTATNALQLVAGIY